MTKTYNIPLLGTRVYVKVSRLALELFMFKPIFGFME